MRKKATLITLSVIMALTLTVGVVFAVFNAKARFNTSFTFSEIGTTLAMNFDSETLQLQNPGDEETANITVNNTANTPIEYSFTLEMIQNDKLAGALLMYFNDEYLGTLAKISPELPELDDVYSVYHLPEKYYLYSGATHSHSIRLEYHIGGAQYSGANASFKLSCSSKSIDVSEVNFVNSFDDFKQAVLQLNYERVENEKIILASDITLTEDVKITKDVTIDLNGYKLLSSSSKKIIIESNILTILDSTKKASTTAPSGSLININGENAYIKILDSAQKYHSAVTITSFDTEKAADYIESCLLETVKYGIDSGNDIDLLKGNKAYFDKMQDVEFNGGSISDAYFTVSQINATAFKQFSFVFGSVEKTIDIKVIGTSSESIANNILTNKLHYLEEVNNKKPVISYNLLLPTRFKEYNCTIEWQSSKPDIISSEGVYVSPFTEEIVELFATIKVNNYVVNKSFSVIAYPKNVDSRFRYFLNVIGYLEFNEISQNIKTPTANNYWTGASDGSNNAFNYATLTRSEDSRYIDRDLAITAITYTLETRYQNYLSFNDNTLTLTKSTLDRVAELNIQVTFADLDEDGEEITKDSIIPVIINLSQYVTHDEVFAFIKAQLEVNGDLTALYMQYPDAVGFSLPQVYGDYSPDEVKITYYIAPAFESVAKVNENIGSKIDIFSSGFTTESQKITLKAYVEISYSTDNIETRDDDLYFYSPRVIRNNSQGLEDLSAYKYVKWLLDKSYNVYKSSDENNDTNKTEFLMIEQLKQLTILDFTNPNNDIKDAAGSIIDVNLQNSINGLKYFTGLQELVLNDNKSFFTNSTKATEALSVFKQLLFLKKLYVPFCNLPLTDLSAFESFYNLTHLSVAGNTLQNLNGLLAHESRLEYLDVANTSIAFANNEWFFAYVYYNMKKVTNNSGYVVEIWYTNSGARTQYAPSHTAGQRAAIEYLARFRDLREMNEIISIPSGMVEATPNSYFHTFGALTPANVTGFQWSYGGVNKNDVFLVPSGMPQNTILELKLTITVAGGSFTRCFFIKYLGSLYT